MGGLEPHGQGAEAAVGGAVEGLAALQQALVEVEADVGLQALRETLQHLGVRTQGQSGRTGTRWCVHMHGRERPGLESESEFLFFGGASRGSNCWESRRELTTIATCVLSFFSKPFLKKKPKTNNKTKPAVS